MNTNFIIGFFVLATACTSSEQGKTADIPAQRSLESSVSKSSSDPKPIKIPAWDASGCGDDDYQNAQLQRHPSLMGQSASDIIAAYGTPSKQEDFKVGEPEGSFYGDYGKRGGSKTITAGNPVRVLTWTKSNCNFSVFFLNRNKDQNDTKDWYADNAFEWGVGADF
jgi:hypothetical protein